jgi:DNA-binding HxlR family transcriptional regulator
VAEERAYELLLNNKLAREILLDIVRSQARSTTQISADLRIPHGKVREVLNELEQEGFLEGQSLAKVPTSATALYSATEKGVAAARSIETMKLAW